MFKFSTKTFLLKPCACHCVIAMDEQRSTERHRAKWAVGKKEEKEERWDWWYW